MIDQNLQTHLVANVAQVNGRVYPYFLPRGCEFPSIAYLQISETPEYVLSGATGSGQTRYQITLFVRTHDELVAIGDAIRAAMRIPIEGVVDLFLNNAQPAYESEVELYTLILDYQISY